MAKQATQTAPAAPTQAPAAPAAAPNPVALAKSVSARSVAAPEPLVVEWNDQGTDSFQTTKGLDYSEEKAGDAKVAAAPAEEGEAAAETPTEGEKTEEPAAAKPPEAEKPKPGEDRRRTLDALKLEQEKRSLETTLKAEQDARKAAAERADGLEAKLKGGTLSEKLKLLGIDRESLTDALIMNSDDVAELPATAPAKEDPTIAELKAKLAALEAKEATRETSSAQQQIDQAITVTSELAKAVDAPVVHAAIDAKLPLEFSKEQGRYLTAPDIIILRAHNAWLEAGKKGSPRDFVAQETEALEALLVERNAPIAAAIAKKNGHAPAPAETAAEQPAKAAGGKSIGKRTAARPDAAPSELPMNRQERDLQIKREFGLT